MQEKTGNIEKDKELTQETGVERTASEDINNNQKKRTFGNKVFDLLIWAPLQWVGVWGLSLFFANEAQNGGRTLQKASDASIKFLTEKLEKPVSSKFVQTFWKDTTAKQWASGTVLITALSLGGSLILPVTKWFEDRRHKISAYIDKAFDKGQENPDNITPEPKQTWTSIGIGRAISMTMTYSIFAFFGPKRIDSVQNKVGEFTANQYMKLRPSADKTKVLNWCNLAVFDLLFTALTGTVTYLSSRVFAKSNEEEKPNQPVKTTAKAEITEEKAPERNFTESETFKKIIDKPQIDIDLLSTKAKSDLVAKKKLDLEDLKPKKPQAKTIMDNAIRSETAAQAGF